MEAEPEKKEEDAVDGQAALVADKGQTASAISTRLIDWLPQSLLNWKEICACFTVVCAPRAEQGQLFTRQGKKRSDGDGDGEEHHKRIGWGESAIPLVPFALQNVHSHNILGCSSGYYVRKLCYRGGLAIPPGPLYCIGILYT